MDPLDTVIYGPSTDNQVSSYLESKGAPNNCTNWCINFKYIIWNTYHSRLNAGGESFTKDLKSTTNTIWNILKTRVTTIHKTAQTGIIYVILDIYDNLLSLHFLIILRWLIIVNLF